MPAKDRTGRCLVVEIFAFACRHKDRPEWQETIVNAQTAGKARYQFWIDVREPWPEVKLIDIRVRKIGGPKASNTFKHVAELRGMPDLEPGERITSQYGDGVIVDAGTGANFEILFDSGKYSGQRLMLHPLEFKRSGQSEKSNADT